MKMARLAMLATMIYCIFILEETGLLEIAFKVTFQNFGHGRSDIIV